MGRERTGAELGGWGGRAKKVWSGRQAGGGLERQVCIDRRAGGAGQKRERGRSWVVGSDRGRRGGCKSIGAGAGFAWCKAHPIRPPPHPHPHPHFTNAHTTSPPHRSGRDLNNDFIDALERVIECHVPGYSRSTRQHYTQAWAPRLQEGGLFRCGGGRVVCASCEQWAVSRVLQVLCRPVRGNAATVPGAAGYNAQPAQKPLHTTAPPSPHLLPAPFPFKEL